MFSFIVTAVCDLHVALSFFWKALFFISLLRLHRLHSCDVQSTRYCIISLRLFLKIIFRDDLGWNFGVNILWWNTNLIHTLFCVHIIVYHLFFIIYTDNSFSNIRFPIKHFSYCLKKKFSNWLMVIWGQIVENMRELLYRNSFPPQI